MVRITWPGGILGVFSDTEDFNLPKQQVVGQSFQMRGTKGSLLTAQVVDTAGCTAPSRIFERTYLQVPDTRFENEVFVYVGDMYHRPWRKKGWVYVIIGPRALKSPDTSNHSAELEPEEFRKLHLKTPYRLDFDDDGDHIEFGYRESKYRLNIRKIDQGIGGGNQSVIVDICPE
jgi:hypothetical protein